MTGPNEKTENIVPLPGASQLEDEAADWLMKLDGGEATVEEKTAFRAWAQRSHRHRETFERLAAVWGDMKALDVLEDHAQSVAHLVPAPAAPVARRTWMAMAATLAIALVGGAVLYQNLPAGGNQHEQFVTAVGEQKTVRLADGSKVQLNTGTRLDVAYENRARKVTLVSGEAFFEVAKDKTRPFSVYAGAGRVTAVGTAFSVRLREEADIEVTVEEGRVALTPGADPRKPDKTPASEIAAGDSARFGGAVETVTPLPAAEVARKLSWRQGVLIYAGEPLAEVVADISRYTDVEIEIADPALRARPMGGQFRVGEIEEMFESLELNLGVTVEHVSDDHVRITSAS